MARHHASALLARIEALRFAERAAALTAVMDAVSAEHCAQQDKADADTACAAAFSRWQSEVESRHFSPELASALGAEANRNVTLTEGAGAALESANAERLACESSWHQSEARCRQSSAMLQSSRRAEARQRAQRATDIAADRATFLWSRT